MQLSLIRDGEEVWVMLRQLLAAPAPTTGVTLPGAVFDQVTDIAAALGLADRLDANLAGAGNGGLWVGVAKARADVVVLAHLDRPSFRVRALPDSQNAMLSPIDPDHRLTRPAHSSAHALRYDAERGKLTVAAQGQVIADGEGSLGFRAEQGTISWLDTVTFASAPWRDGGVVQGAGVDNCAGVLMALGAAAVLRQVEEALLEHNRRCLFIFPGYPGGSLNVMRWSAMAAQWPPVLGTVIVDGQATGASGLQHGAGVACAFHADGYGLLVPINYQQLAEDLAADFKRHTPVSVQRNRRGVPGGGAGLTGDGGRVLGFMGPPLSDPHPGQERVALKDIQAGIWWLSSFLAVVLNLIPAISVRYALGR